ncbi:NtaA/DmoA family FMN-dependent monooxygenase [Microbacterium trichothecenolyticum]|uniref:NtaA/DmoA family FMN-dependent monooxygenase n=1 Tax=Microbacterium trichothecenolyticum TaxID=69370 RepID=UPI001C6E96C5|nr:NtaA/DmoA family FMN-dependent monooxygenase [Microbacterium trichothecenolyticum]MBW9121926.1 NtaA/DmoA family FMN-dependent monooxygenase [Microbacterium trichothecenolyticum]
MNDHRLRLEDYPRPHARLHLNLFQPFGPIYDWSRTPRLRDYYEPDAYVTLVQEAERGLFSAVFLGESLRLREHLGQLNDIAVTGRPDALALFAYLAAHTSRIGLVATLNTTYTDPVDLARRIATVDLLSGGRAGWNVVTTDNGWTGENFRRGGFLDRDNRYLYAEEHVAAVQAIWDGFAPDSIATSTDAESWLRPDGVAVVDRSGEHLSARVVPQVPPSPQGQAVYFQAGDSDEGRDFAARRAEGIFTHHVEFDDAVAFTADIRRRARSYGRSGDDIIVVPGASIVVGDTAAEAEEKARHLRERFLTDRRVRQIVEEVWQEDLASVDLDGPLPQHAPAVDRQSRTHGIVHTGHEPSAKIREWREISEAHGYSIRQLVEHLTRARAFVGTPGAVADELAHDVRSDAFDGLNVAPDAFPDGLGDIVDRLVPELQERGVYPREYPGTTLRDTFGLPDTVGHRVPERATLRAAVAV